MTDVPTVRRPGQQIPRQAAAALTQGPAPADGIPGRRSAGGSALGVDAVPGGHLHRPVAGGAAEDHLAQ